MLVDTIQVAEAYRAVCSVCGACCGLWEFRASAQLAAKYDGWVEKCGQVLCPKCQAKPDAGEETEA